MKRSLCIGIYNLTPSWEALLDQIGVWYKKITTGQDLYESYSTIIVNKAANKEQLYEIRNYLNQGGNVVFVKYDHGFMPDKTFEPQYLTRIYNDLNLESFRHIPYLDIYSTAQTTGQPYLSGSMSFKKIMRGNTAYIGFDPAELLFRTDYTRKSFDISFKDAPDEIVSKVSKGKVSDLFIQILREIHFRSELPFIRKWTSPKERPVFCYRIDSDYGDMDKIDEIHSLLDQYKLKASWFLHVEAHESWLDHFHGFSDQEIALHGYKHGTSRSEQKIIDNIRDGLEKLSEEGLHVSGFCAPYGIYNYALERVLNKIDFKYSSEFTFAYDSLPLKSSDKLLQIPIHPICTGSLNRKEYTIEEMHAYFNEVFERKLARNEPVIFYHHPMQPGLELFESIYKKVREENLTNLTFEEFADFWYKRDHCSFEAYYKSETGLLENVSDNSMLFEVSYNHSYSQLIGPKESGFDLGNKQEVVYSNIQTNVYTNHDAGFIEKLKLIKTSILDYKNRERL